MNNKPVAYMDKKGFVITNEESAKEHGFAIPLYTHPVNPYKAITNTKIEPTVVSYTHPVKELTDSELTDIWKNKLCNQDCPREVYLAFYKEIRKAQKNG